MKKIIILILAFLTFSCSSVNRDKTIPYILSIDAEESIYKSLQSQNNDGLYFFFEHLPNNNFKIHLFEDGFNHEFYFSNRRLLINDRFYPIIFDTDYFFYLEKKDNIPVVLKFKNEDEKQSETVKIPTILERSKNRTLYAYKKKHQIIDHSIFWIVDLKGNLIETNSR